MSFNCCIKHSPIILLTLLSSVGMLRGNTENCMKTEWQFRYETRYFIFEKVHKYKGESTENMDFGSGEILPFQYDVRIEPEPDQEWTEGVIQTGKLLVVLPFNVEEARPIAMFVSEQMKERIAFESGDFSINYGVVYAERIPETPDEVQNVGDAPHAVFMNLTEVDMSDVPSFDSEGFRTSSRASDIRLMSQYNLASKETSSVSQFLGYFRILESLYSRPNRQSIAQNLKASSELSEIFEHIFIGGEFEQFVDEIVHARHRCAHLKLDQGFGYAPVDPEIMTKVEPCIKPLRELSYNCIRGV